MKENNKEKLTSVLKKVLFAISLLIIFYTIICLQKVTIAYDDGTVETYWEFNGRKIGNN